MIRKRHLRSRGQSRGNITARVKRFVASLGQVKSGIIYQRGEKRDRESDEVGHIIADSLGGPHDRTYNFFPQSPYCNMEYYHKVEKPIYDYLSQDENKNAHVQVAVRLRYVDYLNGVSLNRPNRLIIYTYYTDGKNLIKKVKVELSNA